MPKTLDDCKVPVCPNCGWPEVHDGTVKYNVGSLISELINKIDELTGISIVVGFDYKGEMFVKEGRGMFDDKG